MRLRLPVAVPATGALGEVSGSVDPPAGAVLRSISLVGGAPAAALNLTEVRVVVSSKVTNFATAPRLIVAALVREPALTIPPSIAIGAGLVTFPVNFATQMGDTISWDLTAPAGGIANNALTLVFVFDDLGNAIGTPYKVT